MVTRFRKPGKCARYVSIPPSPSDLAAHRVPTHVAHKLPDLWWHVPVCGPGATLWQVDGEAVWGDGVGRVRFFVITADPAEPPDVSAAYAGLEIGGLVYAVASVCRVGALRPVSRGRTYREVTFLDPEVLA